MFIRIADMVLDPAVKPLNHIVEKAFGLIFSTIGTIVPSVFTHIEVFYSLNRRINLMRSISNLISLRKSDLELMTINLNKHLLTTLQTEG